MKFTNVNRGIKFKNGSSLNSIILNKILSLSPMIIKGMDSFIVDNSEFMINHNILLQSINKIEKINEQVKVVLVSTKE